MAATTTREINHNAYRIESLKGAENWFSWYVQIKDVLSDAGILGHADGTNTIPANADEAATWTVNDGRALTAIRIRVAPPIVPHISHCTTSKDAMDALKHIYSSSGTVPAILARRALFGHRCQEGADMETEIRKLKVYKDKLALCGTTLTDSDWAQILLCALPPSWTPFVTSTPTTTSSIVMCGPGRARKPGLGPGFQGLGPAHPRSPALGPQ